MLVSMTPEIQKNLEDRPAFEILQELKTMFQQQAEQELFETVKAFHACKQEEGQFISTYMLKMKAYLDQMEHLGYPMPLVLGVNMILASFSKDYDQFMQNYNMHGMGKIIPELHAMLKLAENGIPKKTPAVLAIRQELKKNKASASGTSGLRGYRKLNKGALDLYVGNGNIAAVEAIGSFDLILPSGMILILDNDHREPPNYQAALSDPESKKWLEAINAEMQSMKDNEVWNLVDLPPNYIKAIRILIAIAAYYDYEIWQMDVKTAFLNGRLNEDVYMVQPEGFVNPKHPRRVCKLQRSIYGLKQASRSWNKRFDEEIKKYGFTQNPDEPCVYKRASGSIIVFLILYVDDILLMGNNIPMLQDVKSWLGKCFAMKDLGEAAYILGIKIYRDRSRRLIGLSQNAYIDKILKRFKMDTSKRGTIPMQPNVDLRKSQGPSTPAEVKRMKGIPYASVNPGESHWTAIKNILKYLRNTKDMFLIYGGDSTTKLGVTCYIDASWETDQDDLRSQTGFVFVMNGGVIDWKSSKQRTTAMSSMEAEYIAVAEAAMEAIWIRKIISGLGVTPLKLGSSGMVTMGAMSKYNNQDIGNDHKWTFKTRFH
ncbi:retrotransposon protein, putative, ty1-copia subclass, partial [Tanacetum coccineum]